MATEYIIYADESIKEGEYFSHFYGGVLVRSVDFDSVKSALEAQKLELNLYAEIKWNKVTENYLQKYAEVMNLFFDFVREGKIKFRLMFTQNCYVPQALTRQQRENGYFLLYYQFIKHAFGLAYSNPTEEPINLRIYLDRLPDTKEKSAQFKSYLVSLERNPDFRRANIHLKPDQIAEVRSHDHVILQCLDVVTGAMQFRLNNKHKVKLPNSTHRGSRTIAKEKLYKHILTRIQQIYPNFNIGVSTSDWGDRANLWMHPYRHWCFVPHNSIFDKTKTKK